MTARIELLENTTLQTRLEQVNKQAPKQEEKQTLKSLEVKGQQQFSLAKHVIPLTQLKSRQDTLEVSLSANSQQIDGWSLA
jgi:hypothetical protein